jgi:transcriptional regulator CtsR
MKEHVIQLSCDRFGCHVMQKVPNNLQKAIEKVDDHLKMELISELFKSIPETFTHRFSCHVWQRVFEIKWVDETPSIMQFVQNAVVGQWAEIANDENGSLVVQCIFEHCTDKEKAPIIADIFTCTLEISRGTSKMILGQWGNWVIQHLLEHGTATEQNHIMEVVLKNSFVMSIDQYASKVVEKCVKVTSKKHLQQFVEEIIKSSDGRFIYIINLVSPKYCQ